MAAMTDTRAGSYPNPEMLDLMQKTLAGLEKISQDIGARRAEFTALKEDVSRIQVSVDTLTEAIRGDNGLVIRTDRLERAAPAVFDVEAFRRDLLREVAAERAKDIENAQKLTPKQIWQLALAVGTVVGALLWLIETRFFGSIG